MSKQTILGRVEQLAKANVDALLDQAEDPQKMVDQLIRAYSDNVAEADDVVASSIRHLRLMRQDHAEDVGAAAEWGSKARTASRKADELRIAGRGDDADRFDHLARVALVHQLQSETEAKIAEPAIAAEGVLLDKLTSGLDRMRPKLDRLLSTRDELVARSRSAPARAHLMDAVGDVDVLDPTCELNRFEDKVRREEAKLARGKQELPASSLDAQFASLDPLADAAAIDARLARLKAETA